jgi:hypothetical protein
VASTGDPPTEWRIVRWTRRRHYPARDGVERGMTESATGTRSPFLKGTGCSPDSDGDGEGVPSSGGFSSSCPPVKSQPAVSTMATKAVTSSDVKDGRLMSLRDSFDSSDTGCARATRAGCYAKDQTSSLVPVPELMHVLPLRHTATRAGRLLRPTSIPLLDLLLLWNGVGGRPCSPKGPAPGGPAKDCGITPPSEAPETKRELAVRGAEVAVRYGRLLEGGA